MLTAVTNELAMTPERDVFWEMMPWTRGGDLLIDPTLDPGLERDVLRALRRVAIPFMRGKKVGRGHSGPVYRQGDVVVKVVAQPAQDTSSLLDLQAGITVAKLVNDTKPTVGPDRLALRALMPWAAVSAFEDPDSPTLVAMPYVPGRRLRRETQEGETLASMGNIELSRLLIAEGLANTIFLDAFPRNFILSEDLTELVKIDTGARPAFGQCMQSAAYAS